MILTGIAKEKFLSEYYKESIKNNWDLNELEYIFNMLPEACQNALIIEWFDSVGIYVTIYQTNNILSSNVYFYSSVNNLSCSDILKTRQEATIQAIKKANDTYNERFK